MSAGGTKAARGRDITRRVFGGTLAQQGRGFYPGLELLAIVRGELLLENAERADGTSGPVRVLPPVGERTRYVRNTHDHARRLLSLDADAVSGVFVDDEAREAVRALLRGMELKVPGRRSVRLPWRERYLYPYPPEAIHHGAVDRRGTIKPERDAYRGAGGLAHKILRTDPDSARLERTRTAFRGLLGDDGGAVGKLLTTLARRDAAGDDPARGADGAFEDDVEWRSLDGGEDGADPDGSGGEPTRWMRLLREGVHRLLTRDELSAFETIDDLVHWVPWCVACHQLAMARRRTGRDENDPLVFDAGHGKSRVREAARRHFNESLSTIRDAVLGAAEEAGATDLLSGSQTWWTGSRTFHSTTLYAVGALNANAGGSRHYRLGPSLLQAIVHALVDRPIVGDRFSREILGDELRIVCDGASAASGERLGLDGLDLQRNGEHLARRLDEVGLSRSYSDSNPMIGIHE